MTWLRDNNTHINASCTLQIQSGFGYIFEEEAGDLIEQSSLSEDKKTLHISERLNDISLAGLKQDLYQLRLRA